MDASDSDKKQKKKIVVLVDMDGVLADFGQGVVDILHRHPHYQKIYPTVEKLFERQLLNKDECAQRLVDKAYKTTPHFFQHLQPMKGALFEYSVQGTLNILDYLQDVCGYEVFICSSPSVNNRDCASDKARWIETYFGNKWIKRLILTKDKTMIQGDILIDDRFSVTGSIPEPSWKHLLFVGQTYAFAKAFSEEASTNSTSSLFVVGFDPPSHVPHMINQVLQNENQ